MRVEHPKVGGKLRPIFPSFIRVDKIDHKQTRMELLKKAARIADEFNTGLQINHQGGAGHNNPDIQWLLKRGYIHIKRLAYGSVWAWDLSHPAALRRTRAFATEKGREAIKRGKF